MIRTGNRIKIWRPGHGRRALRGRLQRRGRHAGTGHHGARPSRGTGCLAAPRGEDRSTSASRARSRARRPASGQELRHASRWRSRRSATRLVTTPSSRSGSTTAPTRRRARPRTSRPSSARTSQAVLGGWHSSVAVAQMEVTVEVPGPVTSSPGRRRAPSTDKWQSRSREVRLLGQPRAGRTRPSSSIGLRRVRSTTRIAAGTYHAGEKNVAVYGEDTDWGRTFATAAEATSWTPRAGRSRARTSSRSPRPTSRDGLEVELDNPTADRRHDHVRHPSGRVSSRPSRTPASRRSWSPTASARSVTGTSSSAARPTTSIDPLRSGRATRPRSSSPTTRRSSTPRRASGRRPRLRLRPLLREGPRADPRRLRRADQGDHLQDRPGQALDGPADVHRRVVMDSYDFNADSIPNPVVGGGPLHLPGRPVRGWQRHPDLPERGGHGAYQPKP